MKPFSAVRPARSHGSRAQETAKTKVHIMNKKVCTAYKAFRVYSTYAMHSTQRTIRTPTYRMGDIYRSQDDAQLRTHDTGATRPWPGR